MPRTIFALALLLGWSGVAQAVQPPPQMARAAIAQGLPLTPQMYGAKGDGIADDSQAIADWLGRGIRCFAPAPSS